MYFCTVYLYIFVYLCIFVLLYCIKKRVAESEHCALIEVIAIIILGKGRTVEEQCSWNNWSNCHYLRLTFHQLFKFNTVCSKDKESVILLSVILSSISCLCLAYFPAVFFVFVFVFVQRDQPSNHMHTWYLSWAPQAVPV